MIYPRFKTLPLGFLLIASFLSLSANVSFSETVASVQASIAKEKQSILGLEKEKQQIAVDITNDEKKLIELNKQLSPLAEAKANAKATLDEALAVEANDPSAENKAIAKNLQFKSALADRKYNKLNKKVSSLTTAISSNKKRLIAIDKDVSKSNGRVTWLATRVTQIEAELEAEKQRNLAQSKQQVVEQAQATSAVEENKAKLAESRLENEKAQQEINRLKAMLADNKRTAPPAVAAAVAPSVAVASSVRAESSTKEVSSAKPAVAAAVSAEKAALNEDAIYARKYNEIFEKHIAAEEAASGFKKVKMRNMSSRKTIKYTDLVLRRVTKNFYRKEMRLSAGKYKIIIDRKLTNFEVPEEYNDNVYLINLSVNAKSADTSGLIIYNKSLL